MFTLIRLVAAPGYFHKAGDLLASRIYAEASAADALRIAREEAMNPCYHAVGIRVGNGRRSRILWVK
jgi:hypothetical protein